MSFFFLLMKVRRESHLSLCDNLSPVIASAPLILIVLYNCVMWTWCSLKYCPYPFIITWCLEPLFIFLPALLCSIHCCRVKEKSLSVVVLKDSIQAWFCFLTEKLSPQRYDTYIFCNTVAVLAINLPFHFWLALIVAERRLEEDIKTSALRAEFQNYFHIWERMYFNTASIIRNTSSTHICVVSRDNTIA